MRKKIINYIRSGHPGLYIVSPEETRVEAELGRIAKELDYGLFAWSVTQGMVNTADGTGGDATDPMEALERASELPEQTIVLLKDFHAFLEDPGPLLVRLLREILTQVKTRNVTVVILGCRRVLPPELERELTVIEFDLPGAEALGLVLDGITQSAGFEEMASESRDAILEAASGLTTTEAENAFALSAIEVGAIEPGIIAREKAASVRKSGLLEVIEGTSSLDEIGGLDVLKNWLLKRKRAFTKDARAFGLPTPKGIMILGIPGTGKSLTAKATAAALGRPLLKLDAGSLFGSLVGQSEANLRSVIQVAEAISPCVLWIDEIEKGFAGASSSGSTDGGTSARVFGTFLSWLQEKTSPVFVVATANDVSQLPPEMLRKGRWDELWFVDLPDQKEREAIWRIQIAKYGREPSKFKIDALARAAEGFTGAEIEQVVCDGLYAAFDKGMDLDTVGLSQAIGETVPLSRLMGDSIKGLREWARGRARSASVRQKGDTGSRKLAA